MNAGSIFVLLLSGRSVTTLFSSASFDASGDSTINGIKLTSLIQNYLATADLGLTAYRGTSYSIIVDAAGDYNESAGNIRQSSTPYNATGDYSESAGSIRQSSIAINNSGDMSTIAYRGRFSSVAVNAAGDCSFAAVKLASAISSLYNGSGDYTLTVNRNSTATLTVAAAGDLSTIIGRKAGSITNYDCAGYITVGGSRISASLIQVNAAGDLIITIPITPEVDISYVVDFILRSNNFAVTLKSAAPKFILK